MPTVRRFEYFSLFSRYESNNNYYDINIKSEVQMYYDIHFTMRNFEVRSQTTPSKHYVWKFQVR